MLIYPTVKDNLLQVFQEEYRELRPRAPIPELEVEFFAFTSINNTIRLRQGKLLVRVSDLLEGAPEPVLRAIAHILLAKLYRRPVDPAHQLAQEGLWRVERHPSLVVDPVRRRRIAERV